MDKKPEAVVLTDGWSLARADPVDSPCNGDAALAVAGVRPGPAFYGNQADDRARRKVAMITARNSELQVSPTLPENRSTEFDSGDGHELLESQDLIQQAAAAKERLESDESEQA